MLYNEQKLFSFPDPWKKNKTLVGFFKFSHYWYKHNTAVQIFAKEKDSEEDFFEPYCFVSVNLVQVNPQSDSCIFVDTNNCPWLEDFLQSKGFGLPTGRFATSGYCNYPEYLLNIKLMKEYQLMGSAEK